MYRAASFASAFVNVHKNDCKISAIFSGAKCDLFCKILAFFFDFGYNEKA